MADAVIYSWARLNELTIPETATACITLALVSDDAAVFGKAAQRLAECSNS